jgi:hypothetical protein
MKARQHVQPQLRFVSGEDANVGCLSTLGDAIEARSMLRLRLAAVNRPTRKLIRHRRAQRADPYRRGPLEAWEA